MSSSSEQQTQSIWRTVPGLNERMRALMVEVYSMTIIAGMLSTEFNLGITKNMVISRSRREGFVNRNPVSRGRPRKQETTVAKHALVPAGVAPRGPDVSGRVVATVDLKTHDCKWPLTSDPPWMHCGQHALEGYSYCEQHCAASYNNWGKAVP